MSGSFGHGVRFVSVENLSTTTGRNQTSDQCSRTKGVRDENRAGRESEEVAN